MVNDSEGFPFSLRELRDAIPVTCFRPSTARSLFHLAVDLCLLALLYAASLHLAGTLWLIPVVFLQGTLLWALFLIGHECGHGAFSRDRRVNEWVGHLVHTPLLVPYHAWRLSHRAHHRHAGDVERDPAWPPLTRRQLRALPVLSRFMRLRGFLFVFPLYLLRNGPERHGSHFDASGPLFPDKERAGVRRSVGLCAFMAVGLAVGTWRFGGSAFVQYWLAPYLVFAVWAALVTYLQHTAPEIPWYRAESWSFLRGALSTVDRRYGWFERLHHDVGSHTVHHLFPRIPHYQLREATRAIEPILGTHLRRAEDSVARALFRAATRCQVISESDGRVFYAPLSERRAASVRDSAWAAPPGGAGSSPATR